MGDYTSVALGDLYGYKPIFNYYKEPITTLKLKEESKKEEKKEMRKCIVKLYPKTEDAVCVEKHFSTLGLGIWGDSFAAELFIESHAEEILNEAKRLEEEEKKLKA